MFLKTGRFKICSKCLDEGYPPRFVEQFKRPQTLGIGKSTPLSRKLTYEYLVEEYLNKKRSLGDIAKEHDCSRITVMKIMKKYGLVRRGQSEARIEAIKKGKFEGIEYHGINENFFTEWSPEMAWVLGLLFTDGNIDESRVAISSVDIDLLEKIKKLLKSSNPIQKRVQPYDKSKHVYIFAFSRDKMRDDLLKLGLHKRKSLTMVFPDVPEEYMRHFIRGCWDGDGSVFISGGKIRAIYICGSFKFIEGLVRELYKIGIDRIRRFTERKEASKMFLKYPNGRLPVTIHKEKRSKSYYIKIDSMENLEKLFNYFYDGVDESMYLERKFKTFAKGLGIITDGLQEIGDKD
jgi:hypothetical protein